MERTKSLSEKRDAKGNSSSSSSPSSASSVIKKANSSYQQHHSTTSSSSSNSQQQPSGRELQRTSSLGFDALYKRWLRPSSSSNVVSSSAQNSSSSSSAQHPSQPNFASQIAADRYENNHPYQPLDPSRPASTAPLTGTGARLRLPEHWEHIAGLIHELQSRSGTMESRLKILEELAVTVRSQPMNEQIYSYILAETKEILEQAQPSDVRHRIWALYTQLVSGRAESLGQYRYLLFNLIRTHSEDIPQRIELLIALTDSGRNISYYENHMADFMVSFLSNLIERRKSSVDSKMKKLSWDVQKDFLALITGLIKFNSSHISSDNSHALRLMIQYTCQLAFDSRMSLELEKILDFFHVVLSYGHLPNKLDSLDQVVVVICIGLSGKSNISKACRQIMHNLLGTHLGFACLSTLLHIIEDQTNYSEPVLIRGAVFFLVQSLWGDLYKEKNTLSPNTVLPAFKNLLENERIASPLIVLEIANGMHSFLMSVINEPTKSASNQQQQQLRRPSLLCGSSALSEELPEATKIVFEWTWELVLDVCHNLVYYIVTKEQELKDANELVSMIQLLIEALKKLLNKVLFVNDHSCSDDSQTPTSNEFVSLFLLLCNEEIIQRIFEILELGVNYLSEQSILKLIAYRLKYISDNLSTIPNRDWFAELNHLMEVFFSRSTLSTNIRIQFLLELEKFLTSNYYFIDPDKFWTEVACNHFSTNCNQNRCCEIGIHFLLYLVKKLNSPDNLLQIVGIFSHFAYFHMKTLFNRKHSVSHGGPSHFRSNAHQQVTHQNSAPNKSDASDSLNDLVHLVEGLVSIFREKIDHQYCHSIAVLTFGKVTEFYDDFMKSVKSCDLELSAQANANRTRAVSCIKCIIVSMILSLRSNSLGQLGVAFEVQPPQGFHLYSRQSVFNRSWSHEEDIKFSSYVLQPDFLLTEEFTNEYLNAHTAEQQPKKPPGVLLHNLFYPSLSIILEYIQKETDWTVLEMVFEKLAKLLKNKGLVMAIVDRLPPAHLDPRSQPPFPDQLVPVLEKFIESLNTRLHELDFGENKIAKTDVLSCVFKSISELVSYPLQPSNQTLLVKCLRHGLVQFSSKTACIRQCIISMTICAIEMPTTIMNKYLKDIIITLSQISSSKPLAVPKLEFLSNIILFPDLYYTFTVKQYLSIFFIATQYVNPYKYGEYTVVLALRVISMWFLKCPSSFRMQLMKFLTKQLSTNILKEVEPTTPQISQRLNSISLSSEHRNSSNSNLDSHHTSLSSSGSAFNVPASSSASGSPQISSEGLILDPQNKELSKVELVEVCMDMFSTNAFNTTSPLPLKPSMIDKLLNRQKSQIWLIGHKLIQITTTACSSRAFRSGLCHKCFHICHMNAVEPEIDSTTPSSVGSQSNIFSDRGTFNSQLSCDQAIKQTNIVGNNNSAIASNRRRHRSEINPSNSNKNHPSSFTNDDYFSFQRSLTGDATISSPTNTPITRSLTGNNASDPDLISSNVDNRYCRCWCQNWAEILVRRSTGNTRWIIRIENNLGDFPYWTYHSKDVDESLADIFSHADPEINLALKMQKEAEEEPDDSIEQLDSSLKDTKDLVETDGPGQSKTSSQEKALIQSHHSAEAAQQRQRASVPVTRAASFGSRRPMMQSNMLEQQASPRQMPEPKVLTQAKNEVLERLGRGGLKKDFSVDQDEPPPSLLHQPAPPPPSQQNQRPSPVYSSASSDMTVTSPDRNSANFRDRSSTISVMTPVQKSASSTGVTGGSNQAIYDPSKSSSTLNISSNRPSISSGALSPQAVFLQLYYNSAFKEANEMSMFDKPILLDKNDALVRSISCLDRVTPYETHKIGVLYVGPGQITKPAILSNQMGSLRYTIFVQKLGHTINLEDVDPNVCFLGGLDSKKDGPYAISWGDHLVQAIFHVGTFMPSAQNDRNCHGKMLHIGNDFVTIIYNNSGEKFDISNSPFTSGQFIQAMVVITPLERESNSVQICAKKEFIDFIGHSEAQIISDNALPVFVRQLALHANLAAMVSHTNKNLKSYNISNWITRLQNIKRIRARSTENCPLYNMEMSHCMRNAAAPQTPHPLSASSPHGRFRLGNGPASQSSRDESDSVISSSVASPNIPGSSGTISSFEYDTGTRLAFPDFTEYTKDPL